MLRLHFHNLHLRQIVENRLHEAKRMKNKLISLFFTAFLNILSEIQVATSVVADAYNIN